MTTLETKTRREEHAAHYSYGLTGGHDLSWIHVQADRLEKIPSNYRHGHEYHSGYLDKQGRQWWSFCKKMPLSPGVCKLCK